MKQQVRHADLASQQIDHLVAKVNRCDHAQVQHGAQVIPRSQ
jgi:hypothetical protein